jgi:uncharacterized protein YdeI (YjbR/CyaY-like superfamily)
MAKPKRQPAARATSRTDPPELAFASAAAWSKWLARHHATSTGIAMRIARKGARQASVSYAEAIEVALAWGWIDGQKGGGDEVAWIQRFAPRKPRSLWSKINRDKALALIERGEMQPAGLAAIERAKDNGQWDAAYEAQSKAKPPADLTEALARSPRAQALFAELDATNRYAIVHRIHIAKLPATRARRVAKLVEMLARGETLYPRRG